jgi:RimJ/RimL family protein N-acetyltransferase
MSRPLLSTPRIRFDNWERGDADLLFELHSDPVIQKGYPFSPAAWTRDALSARLKHYIGEQERDGITKWKLSLTDGTFVGRAGWSRWGDHEIEIGYAILPAFQGRGIAGEAASVLLDWAKRHRPEPLVGFALVQNLASRRILESIGMTCEGERSISGAAFYRLRD